MTTVTYKSGIVKYTTYTREDYENSLGIRTLIVDIFRNLPDFTASLVVINKAIPVNGLDKLLKDFGKDIGKDGNGYIVIAVAGSISSALPASGEVDAGKEAIGKERTALSNANYKNVIFNRKMSNSYTNPNTYIYCNQPGVTFVENNMGEDKIINRFV